MQGVTALKIIGAVTNIVLLGVMPGTAVAQSNIK